MEKSRAKAVISGKLQSGQTAEAGSLIQDALQKGYIAQSGLKTFMKEAKLAPEVRAFSNLPADEQSKILMQYPDDAQRLLPYARKVVQMVIGPMLTST